ncbi:hypothetical protein AUJ40_02810 [Candidatus Berkelbacteria bacterium CG1_02_42_45]|uniref:ComEC/Rec2-related protein domain-containing protein n=3 Tax=Candidatus Berkelbacteria TaxID=1618330 RepID=A0A2H0PZV3_9BACT|nr:MAG: hypothetical protein AUJ40_02810 [Candidatus Berkelbacteria bacterium CG1_02_42_45]PIR27517.1 MAG: hypothetical protein COV40_00420 [Candidatus Berkelbacteria bacterium CG11_big_fil_rev_8_21_14_0_20_42_15]PIZ27836.1 MAG: hypothetical protein COY45_00360 [Candidatus Berkelbacteria bacterium CG_4_10_14_0_8_um_filter_42_34]
MKKLSIPSYRVFTFIMLSFLLGVFISSFFNLDFFAIYSVAIAIVVIQVSIYYIFRRDFLIKVIIFSAISFSTGFLFFSYQNTKLSSQILPFGQDKEFSGVVSSYPENEGNRQQFFLHVVDYKAKLLIEAGRYPEFAYGEKLKIKGKIEQPENFFDFDYINYLKRYSVIGIVKNAKIEIVSKNNGNRILSCLYTFRRKFESTIKKNLPEPESSLAVGILIGSKEGFTDEIMNQFNRTGITHIVALSGFNVTIIIVFLSALLLGVINRKTNFVISIIFVILFVALTGASASVVRAAIISLLLAFGATIGRRADKTNLILLAATVMVAINSFVLRYDIGFQLSFLAYIGLVYFSNILIKFFERRPLKNIPKTIQLAVTETLSAQIIVLPLLLTTFGRISIIAPLTNVLILPIIPLSMLFVFLSAIIFFLLPSIGHLAFLISYLPLKYVLLIAKYFSALPLSSIKLKGSWQIILAVVYSLFIGAIYIYLTKFRWAKKSIA